METVKRIERRFARRLIERVLGEPSLAVQPSQLLNRFRVNGVAAQNTLGELD